MRMAELIGQGGVQLIGVHDGGEDVLRAVFLLGETIDLFIERAGVIIAALILEVNPDNLNQTSGPVLYRAARLVI